MKEFFSKFTFGFLMAQLVPGGVAVLFISMLVVAYRWAPAGNSALVLYQDTLRHWALAEGQRVVVFVLLSVGAGMVIHGLNWMVLAWLENRTDPATPVYESFWHECSVGLQLLVGPFKMVREVAWLLRAPGIRPLRMQENVPEIKAEDEPLFMFVQDFYLHFAQFYAHTAYALLIGIVCVVWSFLKMDVTLTEALLYLVPLYFLTSILFLIGRVQYGSMCKAERELKARGPASSPHEPGITISMKWR